jgi:DNA-binding NarL/FixJ family response regulator
VRILILEPHSMLRATLRDLLDSEPDFSVSAEQSISTVNARQRLDSTDVVLVDESIAGGTSTGARAVLATLAERALVVVMGMGDPVYYEDAHVAAGAVGYWRKGSDIDVLIRLVRAAGLVADADRACLAEHRRQVSHFRRRPAARRYGDERRVSRA